MNKKTAFRLLADDEAMFTGTNAEEQWPINADDAPHVVKNKKNRHLACILLQLETDLTLMKTFSQSDNENKQASILSEFKQVISDKIPEMRFALRNAIPDSKLYQIHHPSLGPHENEHRIESINRCWNILKYLRSCRQAKNIWTTRFSAAGIIQSYNVDASYIPSWLRPSQHTVENLGALKKTASVIEADALPNKEVSVIWKKDTSFDGKDELDEALRIAKGKGIPIPSTHQKLT
ncbi:hypothetical protein B7463_g2771, partial [Scytalidium lignicola]